MRAFYFLQIAYFKSKLTSTLKLMISPRFASSN